MFFDGHDLVVQEGGAVVSASDPPEVLAASLGNVPFRRVLTSVNFVIEGTAWDAYGLIVTARGRVAAVADGIAAQLAD